MNPGLAHTFVFSPPDGVRGTWQTDELRDFSQHLAAAFPEADTTVDVAWDGDSSRLAYSFELPGEGQWLEGMVTATGSGSGSLTVDNATPREASTVLCWFRERYVHPGADLVFTTKLGLENGVDDTTAIPAGTGPDAVAELLGEHAERIDQSLGG